MKILMQNRRDVFTVPGGDTIQMMKTKEALEKKYGIKIDISTELKPDLKNYDIVHLFNVTRVHETYVQFLNAKKQKKPIIISPIYHSIEALNNYEKYGRVGFLKVLNKLVPNRTLIEGGKNIIRSIKDPKQIGACITQLLKGYIEQQRYVLENADLLFVIAEQEFLTMKRELNITHNRYMVVPNGFDFNLEEMNIKNELIVNGEILEEFILCVGRIENRKNQIGLIKALKDSDYKIVFVGAPNPKQKWYYKQFLSLIDNKRFYYLGKINHEEILELFCKARVHILPSWFEVIPLVDIEAALSGCQIVTTKNSYIKEYLEDQALYCDPLKPETFIEHINTSMNKKSRNLNLVERIKQYKWEKVVDNCYQGYLKVMQ